MCSKFVPIEVDALERWGRKNGHEELTAVTLEDLSLHEQIRLVRRTGIFVGQAGSAFTHCFWAQEQTRFVFLLHKHFPACASFCSICVSLLGAQSFTTVPLAKARDGSGG